MGIAQPNFLYANNSLVKNKLHSEERNRNIVIWSYVKQTDFLYIQMLSMCLENNNLSKCPHQLVSVSHSKPRFCQSLYFYGFVYDNKRSFKRGIVSLWNNLFCIQLGYIIMSIIWFLSIQLFVPDHPEQFNFKNVPLICTIYQLFSVNIVYLFDKKYYVSSQNLFFFNSLLFCERDPDPVETKI